MKLSVKADYACRAVAALAHHHPNQEPMRIDDIAGHEAIPANYLVQILIELKRNGLIRSRRGKAGGYVLAKPPGEISVGDVIRAVHGEVIELSSLAGSACPEEIRRVWHRIKTATEKTADGITFEEIKTQAGGRTSMYYI